MATIRAARKLLLTRACACALAMAVGAGPGLSPASASAGGAAPGGNPVANLRLIDYFPSANGWGSMWWSWNPTQMEADFARIAALHANGVRIIVSAPALGFPQPTPTMESRLQQTVAMAAAHGLRVELTLFNEWHNYTDIQDSKTWAQALLAPFQGSPEIAYIDLHDELPVDTNPGALAWAQAMVPYVQSIDGAIPVTVSTSISSGIAPLQALTKGLAGSPPDLYDVHYFGSPTDAYAVLDQAKQAVGGAPLYVGETGFATDSSYGWAHGLPDTPQSLETYQDYYFRIVESATRALELPAAAPWILYDMPGQGGTQWGYHIGILHSNGTPKPAAQTIAGVFAGAPVSNSFNNSFEQFSAHPELPAIWRRWLPGEAKFSIDRSVFHSGLASARITHARGNHLTGCPAYYAPPVSAIVPGTTYTASAWARGRSTAGESRVVLTWTDAAGHFIGSSPSPSLPQGNSEWTLLKVAAKPPAGAAAVEIDLQVCESPGSTWFDDVSFSSLGEAARLHRARR